MGHSTTYCFQDNNYERPDVAGHRSYASGGLKENVGCRVQALAGIIAVRVLRLPTRI